MTPPTSQRGSATVAGIPVRWVTRNHATGDAARRVALWLPYLGGTKDDVVPMLERLADAGFFAVSFDPSQHGERSSEPTAQLQDRMIGAFRREMWPVIGQSTLDAMWVLDWITDQHDVSTRDAVAGGLSMGGDICVALAGIDHRVARVAAIGSTPDWTRPGMRRLDAGASLIDQGLPGAFGRWLYSQLDPITHLEHFAHGPAILFESGQDDVHVPVEAAHRFVAALTGHSPAAAANTTVRVTKGLAHIATLGNPDVIDRCVHWLTKPLSKAATSA